MKVAIIAQMEYFKFHFENDLDDLYEMKKFQLKWNVPAEYYDPVVQFAPDLTLVYRGEFLPVEVVRALPGIKVSMSTEPMPKIVDGRLICTHDTLNRFRLFLGTLDRPYDYILHFDELSKSFFETQNIELSGFYRFPIATGTYKPAGISPHRDVVFFGRSTPHRENYLGPLKQHLDTLHVVHGMPGPNEPIDLKYLSLVSSFHIALNLHPEKEISWEPRIQRMMACGLLVVTEPISPNPYLAPGRDYLCVNSPAELYQLCQDIVGNPDNYAHIRKAGFDRVQESFRAIDVFPELFGNLISGRFPRPRAAPVPWKLDLLSAALQVTDAESLIRRALARDA